MGHAPHHKWFLGGAPLKSVEKSETRQEQCGLISKWVVTPPHSYSPSYKCIGIWYMYNDKMYISIYMIITSMCFMYMCVHMCIHLQIYMYTCIYFFYLNVYIYIYISNSSHSRTPPGWKTRPIKTLHLGDELNLLRIDFGETASGRFQVWIPMEKNTELLGGSSHLLLMAEIPNSHLGCINPVNNGINYLSTG